MTTDEAVVGVSDHAGWAVLVTVAGGGAILDRRRIRLVDEDLPSLPHHHDAQGLPLDQALDLIGRVQRSAERHATQELEALAAAVGVKIRGAAIRRCPPLPATVAERLGDYRAQNVADTVMFRTALAEAAERRGWDVRWYETRTVIGQAARALDVGDMDELFAQARTRLGPPWTVDHRLAMSAAVAFAD